jgi:hypothetical protein
MKQTDVHALDDPRTKHTAPGQQRLTTVSRWLAVTASGPASDIFHAVKQRARRVKRPRHPSDRKPVLNYVSCPGRRAGFVGAPFSCLIVAGVQILGVD